MRALIAAAIVLVGGGCHHIQHPSALPRCVGSVVTVVGDQAPGCNLTPPQRLDVTGVTIDQCDDMGGEPISMTLNGPITCEGVDY